MDLFEPGTGSPAQQVHDFNGGILASGLFWTLPADDHALRISRDGRRAVIQVRDLPVIDSFQFFGPSQTPATVSFRMAWKATGPFMARGSGDAVDPEDPAAFRGRFAVARSTGTFSGSEFGFSFRSNPGVSTVGGGFAEMGRERNGVFLD